MQTKIVGVIGAGTMGNGIAQVMAAAGLDVVLNDINQAAVDKGLAAVGASLNRLVSREKMTEAASVETLQRINPRRAWTTSRPAIS